MMTTPLVPRTMARLYSTTSARRSTSRFDQPNLQRSSCGHVWCTIKQGGLGNPRTFQQGGHARQISSTADDSIRCPSARRHDDKGQTSQLTHVNAAGEARMVDVGEKTPTRRVAVATSLVKFGTARAAHDLIQDNTNRKGDVLGVARIAGIMAAKRTSDLIPLCHPLQLTKVVVELELEPPDRDGPRDVPHGGVRIQAHVECFGPTGVEMEALVAVLGAAATVVDMSKAVDKRIVVDASKVVYKSGGRSGVFADAEWLKERKAWLTERELMTP